MEMGISASHHREEITTSNFDLAIVGGGLAGLALAILQATAGKQVILFEKHTYPHHKVCGEYISLESWDFLISLGLPLAEWKLPLITQLQVTSPLGYSMQTPLDLGGFGISRYRLDKALADVAQAAGVTLRTATRVDDVVLHEEEYEIITSDKVFKAKQVVGSFGKRTNLDVKWQRSFLASQKASLTNYVAVKYHIKIDHPTDTIALHNFSDGYCGMSAVEDGLTCLCYLTTKANLLRSNQRIELMEQQILQKNPHLKRIFQEAEFVWPQPLTISNISFENKTRFERQIPLIGDAAGVITPLCGNGMSMALHGAWLLHNCLETNTLHQFEAAWQSHFGQRLSVGRWVQSIFGHAYQTDIGLRLLSVVKPARNWLIRHSHGQPFYSPRL